MVKTVVNKLITRNNLWYIYVFEVGAGSIAKVISVVENTADLWLKIVGPSPLVLLLLRERLLLSAPFAFVFMLCNQIHQGSTTVLKPLNSTDNISLGHLLIFQEILERSAVISRCSFMWWNKICSSKFEPINIWRILFAVEPEEI